MKKIALILSMVAIAIAIATPARAQSPTPSPSPVAAVPTPAIISSATTVAKPVSFALPVSVAQQLYSQLLQNAAAQGISIPSLPSNVHVNGINVFGLSGSGTNARVAVTITYVVH